MTPQERFKAAWPADWQPDTPPFGSYEKSTHLMIGQSRLNVNWRKNGDAFVTCNILCNEHGTPYVVPSAISHSSALACIPEVWAWAALDEVIAGRPLPTVPEWARVAIAKARLQRLDKYAKQEAELRAVLVARDRIASLCL